MGKFSGDFIQYNEKKVKNESKHLTLYLLSHSLLYIVLLFFCIFFTWYTVFITTHKFYVVKGPSMMQTLNSQISDEQLFSGKSSSLSFDAVYVDKVSKPKIFDIVVIEKKNSDDIIKRLMAKEGDYITIAQGENEQGESCFNFYRIPKGTNLETFSDEQALVDEISGENGYSIRSQEEWTSRVGVTDLKIANGQEKGARYCERFYYTFLEDYLDFGEKKYNYFVSDEGLVYVQVPDKQIFYMGDNRAFSTDSREVGFCDASLIVGRSEFIVYNFNLGNRILEVIKFYFSEMNKFFVR